MVQSLPALFRGICSGRLRKAAQGRRYLVSRLAGNEFAIVLRENLIDQHLYRFCGSVAEHAHHRIVLDEQEIHPSVSIGVARYPDHGLDENALLANASLALKECTMKTPGKACLYHDGMQVNSVRNRLIKEKLRMTVEAQQSSEMELHYQSKVNLDSGEIVGIEALLRCQDNELGFVSPIEVFDIAGKSALVQSLSLHLFKQVIRDVKAWSKTSPDVWPVAYNVHPGLLQDPGFFLAMLNLIDENGLSRRSIILEITEDCILHEEIDTDTVPRFLQSRVDQGYLLSLDDFGTGFASLTLLKEIPSSEIKIDRSFVLDIVENPESEAIVKALIAVGLETGKSVVAEGIETIEQLVILKQHNCRIGQGNMFSMAVESQEITSLLETPKPYESWVKQAELSFSGRAVAWRMIR